MRPHLEYEPGVEMEDPEIETQAEEVRRTAAEFVQHLNELDPKSLPPREMMDLMESMEAVTKAYEKVGNMRGFLVDTTGYNELLRANSNFKNKVAGLESQAN